VLPHRFPFQLIEVQAGAVRVRLSANATWLRSAAALPTTLGIEVLAQAAILYLPEMLEGGGKGLLAGVDEAIFHRPLAAGETWDCAVKITGRFGKLVKIAGSLVDGDGRPAVEAQLLLARLDA
jgi:3-hydroxymyristoyl/3-hydroxydecanoyl-(acyl carrier protein) dehydratase